MQESEDSSAYIAALVEPEKFRAPAREHLFRTEQSLRWFIRRNRDALVGIGALRLMLGRWYVHPARFDDFLVRSSESAECTLVLKGAACGRLHEGA